MKRREFVARVGVGGVAILLLPSTTTNCNSKQLEALRPWEGPNSETENQDIRITLVAYATLAPNAHNKQPWLIDLRGAGIDLYIDPSRLLPQTDPLSRQVMISQGTFIETLAIAASHYGIAATITLFPNGIDALDQIGRNPVAHIALTKEHNVREDELFSFVLKRHTNRRAYEGPSLTESEIQTLARSCGDEQHSFRAFTDSSVVSQIAQMMTDAMHIETHTRAMHAETVDMLRFNDEEVERHRDGISFPNLGITGTKLFFAKMFANRSSAFDESFLNRTVESVKEGAFSARGIGLIGSRTATRIDEVMAGRNFARLFLTATRLGLSLQPMSQILEIASIKSKFMEVFKIENQEPQMIFRLGRSQPTSHSPRRSVNDFLKS